MKQFLSTIFFVCCFVPVIHCQTKPDVIIFDEDDPVGSGYYDASWGYRNLPSMLLLGGPGNDKLVISSSQSYSGAQSGVLQWQSVSGGIWKLFVSSWSWATRDVSGYDSLILFVNSQDAIPASALPKIALESSTNVSTPSVNLSSYLSNGIDADPTSWQRLSIPLTAFEPYGGFSLSSLKDVNFSQGTADNIQHTMLFDYVKIVSKTNVADTTLPSAPKNVVSRFGDRSVALCWERSTGSTLLGYNIYRATIRTGPYTKQNVSVNARQNFADLSVENGMQYYYYVRAVTNAQAEGPTSDTVFASPKAFANDNEFLDYLEQTTLNFFWYEAEPSTGLIRDRNEQWAPSSIASVGFGLTALGIGVERGWLLRSDARNRTLATLKTFWTKPQGSTASGIIGYRGWFYHFIEMATGERAWNCELSSIDTGLLLAGIIYVREFYDGTDSTETTIRALADSILNRVEWNWMRNGGQTLTMGWNPTGSSQPGFINARWIGYNEAMILYLIGLGAQRDSLPSEAWSGWTNGYNWQTHYGYSFVNFPPLFGHQYSHCWVDFRNIADAYMKYQGITYFENSRRATLAQRAYCIANPGGFLGYSANIWGLTACDGPGTTGYYGYIARGTPPATNDDGTIAPTAAGGSIAFAPEIAIPALRFMYDTYRSSIWTAYGFRDAFNLKANWWGPDVIGIDQGPIIIMAENFRTGSVWNRFMQSAEIQRGLQRAGFTPITAVEGNKPSSPSSYLVLQNYPNPFNPVTTIEFHLPSQNRVTVKIYDALGRQVALLLNEDRTSGVHRLMWNASGYSSGIYFCRLQAGSQSVVQKLLLLQ